MPRTRRLPEPPEKYEVQINPNTLAIALESALRTATRAAVRRDRSATAGSERAESRAASLAPEYVADVRGVVAGIAERHRAAELERQAERIGKAAQGVIDGAGQLELTATAVARCNERLERQAERLSSVTRATDEQRPPTQAGGVAEVVLRRIAPDALARYQAQIAQAKATEPPIEQKPEAKQDDKRRRRREILPAVCGEVCG